MKPIFTADDFENIGFKNSMWAAQAANAKLEKLMAEWPVVYSKRWPAEKEPFSAVWAEYETEEAVMKYKNTGYQARLAFIEELPKEECKHEPDRRWQGQYNPDAYPEGRDLKRVDSARCIHCGVELVAKWEAK